MKTRQIAYWAATVVTAFVFLSGGTANILHLAPVMEGMARVGYPAYFVTILGVWKVLGGVLVLAPRLGRVKEWAYAGMFFDLSGAALSHVAVGDPAMKSINPLLLLAFVVASWALRPESRQVREASSDAAEYSRRAGIGEAARASAQPQSG